MSDSSTGTSSEPITEKVQVWIHGVDKKGTRKALLLQTNERRGSFWQPVTGRVDPGENIECAAAREPREETGFDLPPPRPLGMDLTFGAFHETAFEMELDVTNVGQAPRLDPKEHQAYEWVDLAEAGTRLKHESNREVLKKLLEVTQDRAPDFRLEDQDGKSWNLSQALLHKPILLVFYPGDFTPVCTKQLCEYRDDLQSLVGNQVALVGVSPDSPEKHIEFIKQYGFKFPLLSDPERRVFGQFGVRSKLLMGMTSRGIFLIGRDQHILYRHVETTPLTFRKAAELKDVLARLPV